MVRSRGPRRIRNAAGPGMAGRGSAGPGPAGHGMAGQDEDSFFCLTSRSAAVDYGYEDTVQSLTTINVVRFGRLWLWLLILHSVRASTADRAHV